MKEIPLGNSQLPALVDDEDFSSVENYTWYAMVNGYVARGNWSNNVQTSVLLHRQILRARRTQMAGKKYSNFKGVCYQLNKWVACIRVNYRQIHLGRFLTEIEAASAYNQAAIKYFGEFALLNQL